jgi:hypothetical protein
MRPSLPLLILFFALRDLRKLLFGIWQRRLDEAVETVKVGVASARGVPPLVTRQQT